jgi:hypothetical protein
MSLPSRSSSARRARRSARFPDQRFRVASGPAIENSEKPRGTQ